VDKYPPVPIRLRTKTEKHAKADSDEGKTGHLCVEPMPLLKYNRKCLEREIQDTEDECIPGEVTIR